VGYADKIKTNLICRFSQAGKRIQRFFLFIAGAYLFFKVLTQKKNKKKKKRMKKTKTFLPHGFETPYARVLSNRSNQ